MDKALPSLMETKRGWSFSYCVWSFRLACTEIPL
uniref:Uncharacterized protein n=1 Tax=Arundo donax TaxID=35708 RepID=A0A0A8YXG0_ARUDO